MANREYEFTRALRGLTALRVVASLLLVAHGAARINLGIVDDFGGFLAGVGIPFGVAIAWLLTVVEIFGGMLLAFGRLARWLALFFVLELSVGILLVHAQEGWFVVGAGRNGMEYSVLLIAVLVAVAWVETPKTDPSAPRSLA